VRIAGSEINAGALRSDYTDAGYLRCHGSALNASRSRQAGCFGIGRRSGRRARGPARVVAGGINPANLVAIGAGPGESSLTDQGQVDADGAGDLAVHSFRSVR
jgi:hypothetical protein